MSDAVPTPTPPPPSSGAAAPDPPARPDPPVVDDPDGLTPAWLTAALRAGGLPGVTVRAVRHEPVGTGQMAACHRLHLDTTGGGPDTLVAKLSVPGTGGNPMVANAYRTEVAFYAEVAPTVAARTPACHHHAITDDHARFTLLLEDMAPARPGDQIAGCSVDEARHAAVNLAGLHGPRWCDPTLRDHEWLRRADPEGTAFLAQLLPQATRSFVDRFAADLDEADAATLLAAADAIGPWALGRPERFSLVHGDYRLDNLLFPVDGGTEVAAVDWQTVSIGLPGRDLAYLLATSLDPTERRAQEADLVAAYHKALRQHGRVADHTLDECVDDYRYGALQAPLVTVLGWATAGATDRGDQMFLAMTRRSCAAIRDLGTLDLV